MIIGTRWAQALVLIAVVAAMMGTASPLPAQQQSPTSADTSSPSPSTSSPTQSTSSPSQPKTGEKSADKKEPASQEQQSPKNDRLFYVLPNYLTVENAKQTPPLTTGQKFKLQALGTFDPVEFLYVGTIALINQSENNDPSYGRGIAGYAKRYGIGYADTIVENFTVGAVLPSLLHEDPRFYQLGKGTFFHRVGYAAERAVVTRSDSGKKEFNFSEVAGSAIAAAVSNTYHPAEDRTFSNSVNTWWEQVMGDLIGFEVKEFWPDIHRKLHRKN